MAGQRSVDSSNTGRGSTSASDLQHEREHADENDRSRVEEAQKEKYGGLNLGADFFGWLVAIALTVLLVGVIGAIAAAVGASLNVNQTDAERQAGTFGLATAIALLLTLMIAYYAGGYVAGRMSRFDGGKQGVGVWVIGLLVTLIVVGLGAIFVDPDSH